MKHKVFFSYAHEDEGLRDKLASHLSRLKREGAIAAWHDREIRAGTEWEGEIRENLASADIILLLISADFLASDFIWKVELTQAIERHEDGNARIIPIILRPTDWQIDNLKKLQALPTNAKPITTWDNEDEAFLDVVQGIRRVIQALTLDGVIEKKLPDKIAPNPFGDRGRITQAERFFGREFLLQEIFAELRKGGSISLVGESQVGKSSILEHIRQQGREILQLPPEAFIYLNMELIGGDDEFFEELCYELKIETCRRRSLRRKLQGNRYILCLDQIEKMTNKASFTKDARAELRGLADGADMPLTLMIASRSPLNQLFPESSDETSPLYNLCRRLEVKPFTFEVTVDFIRDRLRGTGVQFSKNQIQELWDKTQGHPGKLQAEAHELYRKFEF